MLKRLIAALPLFLCLASAFVTMAAEPDMIDVKVQNLYKSRPDGSTGRVVMLTYHGQKQLEGAKVEIFSSRGDESFSLSRQPGNTFQILLSPEIGVSSSEEISVSLIIDGERLSQKVNVTAMRHWTVYIYPHSHVDIGYTNTQENVEFIHKRNLDVAMDLAEQTRNYPEEARFRWNPEVVWPVERYLKSEPADERKRLIDAIKRGDISVDASYVNTNTSACSDEELFQLFSFGKEIENITGKKLETMVQTDIPGMSWGVVTAANENGIKYILSLFNGSDRTGWTHKVSFRPFWWVGQDGKSKVLFLQPGDYTPGAVAKGKFFWPLMAGQTDTTKLLHVVKTDNPRENFIDGYLERMLPKLEAVKIILMTFSL